VKRILPFVSVFILLVVVAVIASQTQQGAAIRAVIQKRVQERLPVDLPTTDVAPTEVPA
jgi:branched-subunit amino acid ABC-type transport system permease component